MYALNSHQTVWSECTIDSVDEDQTGDNRDGDEKWYQYRTQNFCANSAYSLYGQKRHSILNFKGCTERHYINSYFTYGGADTLLKAVGITPIIYNDGSESNAVCYGDMGGSGDEEAEEEEQNDDQVAGQEQEGAEEDGQDYNNQEGAAQRRHRNRRRLAEGRNNGGHGSGDGEEEEEEEQNDDQDVAQRQRHRRHLAEGRNNNGGHMSSLGCDAKGNYIMGLFNSETCDGNYFVSQLNSFDEYNDDFNIGCTNIWKRSSSGSSSSSYTDVGSIAGSELYELLTNSWTCDIRLYPNGGCPDPYGRKKAHDFALRTASHGGNAHLSYLNSSLRRPLRILSGILIGLSLLLLLISYFVKRQKGTQQSATSPDKGCYLGVLPVSPGSSSSGDGGSPISAHDIITGIPRNDTLKTSNTLEDKLSSEDDNVSPRSISFDFGKGNNSNESPPTRSASFNFGIREDERYNMNEVDGRRTEIEMSSPIKNQMIPCNILDDDDTQTSSPVREKEEDNRIDHREGFYIR